MSYSVSISKPALKALKKMDKSNAAAILSWIKKNLEGTDNPYKQGKRLKGNLSQFWRYRVGDYRILCSIEDGKLIIIVVAVGHRREIYE